jgi:hypothetical protein
VTDTMLRDSPAVILLKPGARKIERTIMGNAGVADPLAADELEELYELSASESDSDDDEDYDDEDDDDEDDEDEDDEDDDEMEPEGMPQE